MFIAGFGLTFFENTGTRQLKSGFNYDETKKYSFPNHLLASLAAGLTFFTLREFSLVALSHQTRVRFPVALPKPQNNPFYIEITKSL
jgi:hypothetical protein